ncbi:hypothetical protein CS542_01555 [Pedobacter sp. IW39]|nr:hypothetical protein CS542_01555 [Pedobacter sp. IW39]
MPGLPFKLSSPLSLMVTPRLYSTTRCSSFMTLFSTFAAIRSSCCTIVALFALISVFKASCSATSRIRPRLETSAVPFAQRFLI